MIPRALQLSNFMSYRTPTAIDFDDVRMACLSGDNGAGKSAILDAITWAVWGKSRASSDRDVITIGATQMEVTFDFGLQDREYRVFRRVVRRGSDGGRTAPTLEFYVREPGNDDWSTISGDNVRETDRKIVDTLKMDYETFVNSAYLMQGEADTFTQKRPGDRKKVLADILSLGDYDILSGMARDEERTLRSKSGHLTSLIARIDEQLEHRPAVEAELTSLSTKLIDIGGAVDRLEAESRSLQDALNAMAGLVRNRDASIERLERQRRRLHQVEGAISGDRATLERLNAMIDRGDAIESGYADLQKWRGVAESCAEILRQRQPVEKELRETERQIEQQRSDLQRKIDRHLNAEKQAATALATLTQREVELQQLKSEVAGNAGAATRFESVRDTLRVLESEKATLEAECKSLMESMNEIKTNMELLRTGDAACPICRRPMDAGEHEHVAALWTAEGTDLGNRYRSHQKRLKAIGEEIPQLRKERDTLDATRTLVSQQQAVVRRLEQELSGRPELEKQVKEASREGAELTTILSNGAFAPQLMSRAGELSATLEKLTYDAQVALKADEEIKRLRHVEAEHAELQSARIRFSSVTASLAERTQTAAETNDEIETLERELAEIQRQLEDEPALRKRADTLTDEIERARTQRDEIQGAFGGAENQMAHLDRLANEQQAHKAEIGTMALDADAFRELAVAFGRNGIQAMIVETILPELEDEANRLLARMTTSHLHVSFRSTRQAITNDNIIETLDIIIRDESGERPYAMYSGGEAFRIDFAIRVALSKLLARRAGATIDMLIVDEGFGTQDARGRDGLVEALQSVESDFATILVITHIDEVRDLFPTRIEVTKTDEGSQVAVV